MLKEFAAKKSVKLGKLLKHRGELGVEMKMKDLAGQNLKSVNNNSIKVNINFKDLHNQTLFASIIVESHEIIRVIWSFKIDVIMIRSSDIKHFVDLVFCSSVVRDMYVDVWASSFCFSLQLIRASLRSKKGYFQISVRIFKNSSKRKG